MEPGGSMERGFFARGDLVALRRLDPEDVGPAYLGWMNDPEVVRFLDAKGPFTLEGLRAYVASCADDPGVLLAGIFLLEDGSHVGNVKLGPVDPEHGTASIAGQAIGLMAAHAFEELGLAKLTAGSLDDNKGSIKAFLKCGFEIEGVRRSQRLFEGRRTDVVYLGRRNPAMQASAE